MCRKLQFSVILVCAFVCPVRAAEPVFFADPALKAEVEEQLGITDPTPTDMLGLFSLDCSGRNITSLAGLEHAVNLKTLIVFNPITTCDISQLAYLTQLEELTLRGIMLRDPNDIPDLDALELLWLEDNNIIGLDGLLKDGVPRFPRLCELGLLLNDIEDISPLSYFTSLESLNIRHQQGNKISDCSPVAALTNLMYLNLGANNISDISSLENLTELRELHVFNNHIDDIAPLANLQQLERVWVHTNPIHDLSPLAGLTGLVLINARDSNISDLASIPWSQMTRLDTLKLSSNPISDLSLLSELPSIEWLCLNSVGMTDCSFLSGLSTLQRLELAENLLTECHCVSGLINLEALHLNNNDLPDCNSHGDLSALYRLERLYLQDNHIADISSLTGLTSLQELNLQYNELDVDDYCCELALVRAHNPGVKVIHDPCPSPPVGDFDFDCWVGAGDFALLASAWMTDLGSDGWDDAYDVSIPPDGRVDMEDLQGLARHWLECPGQCD